MVGYYHNEPIPPRDASQSPTMSNVIPTLDSANPVKSLVCSPDLSIFSNTRHDPSVDPLTTLKDEKFYHCLLCEKSFSQKTVYQSHLRSHGKEGEDPYRCDMCGKTFAVPARLTRHYRTHTGEKPFECEYCKKSFSVKENLSVHRRIHTKERPYKCNVCARAFEHSGKLHRHMRIHTGERPHKCSYCAKTFIQSGQLVIHMRTHTGEKPYVCKSCGKGFTCSKQLKVHTRTHTGEKPYTCDICGKSFGYNHVLKFHQVAHFGEKVYKCTLCHETFNSKKAMEMHIKTHSDSTCNSPRSSPVEPVVELAPNTRNMTNINEHNSNGNGVISNNKENKKEDEPVLTGLSNYVQPREFYYVYSHEQPYQPHQEPSPVQNQHVLTAITSVSTPPSSVGSPVVFTNDIINGTIENGRPPQISVIDSSMNNYVYPEIAFNYANCGQEIVPNHCATTALLHLPGVDARRRVEAALEAVEEEDRQREFTGKMKQEQILTPPSSNPVSPASSPDPLDLAIPVKEALILPPRKRCKMILESMETERTELLAAAQRHSSVIRFARAS